MLLGWVVLGATARQISPRQSAIVVPAGAKRPHERGSGCGALAGGILGLGLILGGIYLLI